jgi:TonB-dependent receptor
MYNRSAEDQVRTYQGQNTDTGRDARVTRLQFVERGVFVGSAGMTHVLPLFSGMTFDWKASYSQSERNEPDRREYLYEQFERTDPTTGETTETWELTRRTKDLGFTRMYTYMDDYDRGLQADLQTAFHAWNGFEAKVKIGALNKNKDRISSTRRFAYRQPLGNSGVDFSLSPEELLVDENIGASQQQFVLQELTKGTDTYEAKHDLQAGYAMVDMPLAHRVRLVTGARVEKSDFRVVTQDPFTPDAEPVVAKLEDTDVLPSANVTFAVTDEVNLRAAFSSTIARPDIRELTPFSLPEFQSGYALIGNPDLKRSLLRNYDFRAEYYPGPGELLAISGFYKDLQDPIELSLQPVAGNPAMRPVNAGEATLRGLEMEARVGLGRVTKALAPFALSTNATFVSSRAKIEDEAAAVGSGTRERPLQGQPPYVYNGGLFFQTLDGGTSASLLYNVFGRRLHAVGLRNTPDIYEEPRHSLDLTAGQRIGPVRVKASATNILDADAEFTQELDNGTTFVQHRNDTGRGLSLSLSYGG